MKPHCLKTIEQGLRAAAVAMLLLLALPNAIYAQACCGDCNDNGTISIGELQQAVNNFLGACYAGVCSPLGATLPVTGQTTTFGPDSDASLQAGSPFSFVDNGNGTITDLNTRLIWEKKDDSFGIHGRNNLYTWGLTTPPYTMDGTIVSDFLNTLNTGTCFAGYCDWRIPNVRELQSLQNFEGVFPAASVDGIFHNPAGCSGCTDVTLNTCSCTRIDTHWTSTTYRTDPINAFIVSFAFGTTGRVEKTFSLAARAVRGGL